MLTNSTQVSRFYVDKHKVVLREQEHKFVAQRLIQDTTQMMTGCKEQNQRLQQVLSEWRLGATAQDQQTELERNVELLRHDQVTGGGMRSNLEKETELLFAEADASRQERADKLV